MLFVLVIADAWGVVDTKMAISAAARYAAHTFVEAPSPAVASQDATAAALADLAASGRTRSGATVSVTGSLARCALVTVVVSYRAHLVRVPLLGLSAGHVTVRAHQSEMVDPYRNGLPGVAGCG